MNISEFCRVYRVDEACALAMGRNWWRSQSEIPASGPEFLKPETLRENFRHTGLVPEALGLLEEMNARINADPQLVQLAWHAHRCLVVYDQINFREWSDFEELFAGKGGLFYLLIACSVPPFVRAKLGELGIPEEYLCCCTRIRGYYDTYMSGYGKPGLNRTQLHWLRHYIDGTVFRVGRFEYMLAKAHHYNAIVFRHRRDGRIQAVPGPLENLFDKDGYVLFPDDKQAAFCGSFVRAGGTVMAIPYNPDGVAENRIIELPESDWEVVVRADSDVLGVHIPEGGKMTPELCGESFRLAFEFFGKYFPQMDFQAIFCASWIFYPYYEQVLPESNLAKLMRELYLFPRPSSGHDGVYFIFGREKGDYMEYPRDNSMRRAMLDVLQNGGRLRSGGMFFLKEHLPLFGQSPYRKMQKNIEN